MGAQSQSEPVLAEANQVHVHVHDMNQLLGVELLEITKNIIRNTC